MSAIALVATVVAQAPPQELRAASRARLRPPVEDLVDRTIGVYEKMMTDLRAQFEIVEKENTGLRKEATERDDRFAEATAVIADLSEKLNEATEKVTYRARARRLSALAGGADRTTIAIERMIADLKGRIERAEGENLALKAEAAERECRFTEITEASRPVIDLIHSQTATYKFLTYKIKCLFEVIDNAKKILASAPK